MLKRWNATDIPVITKNKAFKALDDAQITYDYALPQRWLDNFSERNGLSYNLISSTTVWCYLDGYMFGFPVSIAHEVQEKIDREFPYAKEALDDRLSGN